MKILVIEDDHDLAKAIQNSLASQNYSVEVSNDGAEGSFLARNYDHDLIILDYSLPKKNGLMVCEETRRAGKSTPIIFLSATHDTDLKIKALNIGADDYVTKPFSINELQARILAVTRRPRTVRKPCLRVADLSVDCEKHIVKRGPKTIFLSFKEFNLLEYMMKNVGRVLSRTMILEHVWSSDINPISNTIESHINSIRRKITSAGKSDLIINIQRQGYILDSPENLKIYQGRQSKRYARPQDKPSAIK